MEEERFECECECGLHPHCKQKMDIFKFVDYTEFHLQQDGNTFNLRIKDPETLQRLIDFLSGSSPSPKHDDLS